MPDTASEDSRRHSLADRLEAKIDRLTGRLDELVDILGEGLRRQAVSEQVVKVHDGQIERLNREVFEGNGHPSLTSRMTSVEHSAAQAEREAAEIRKRHEATSRVLFGKLEKVDERIEKTEEAKSAKRWQWIMLGASAAALAVSAADVLVNYIK